MTVARGAERLMGRTLYFVRHGETDWNREGRLQGQQDIPLNSLGREQAVQVGLHLRELLGSRIETLPWLASPMHRTMETMRLARQAIGLTDNDYMTDVRLKEIHFGKWERMTWAEVTRHDPAGARARSRNKWNFVPPEGESYAMLSARIRPVLEEHTAPMIMVAHGGVARALMVMLAGADPKQAALNDIWQGRILVFEPGGYRWVP